MSSAVWRSRWLLCGWPEALHRCTFCGKVAHECCPPGWLLVPARDLWCPECLDLIEAFEAKPE